MKRRRSGGVISLMGPTALGRLLDDHAAALTLYARQWTAAPEDAVQDAFVKLAGLLLAPRDPVAWLYVAVRRRAISAGRAERRRRHHEAEAAIRGPAWFLPAEASPHDAHAAADALRELPDELREPIVARLWGGLTFGQIGRLVGCSAATAFRRYTDGLARLRARLERSCPNRT